MVENRFGGGAWRRCEFNAFLAIGIVIMVRTITMVYLPMVWKRNRLLVRENTVPIWKYTNYKIFTSIYLSGRENATNCVSVQRKKGSLNRRDIRSKIMYLLYMIVITKYDDMYAYILNIRSSLTEWESNNSNKAEKELRICLPCTLKLLNIVWKLPLI